jgi:hypothetical protein
VVNQKINTNSTRCYNTFELSHLRQKNQNEEETKYNPIPGAHKIQKTAKEPIEFQWENRSSDITTIPSVTSPNEEKASLIAPSSVPHARPVSGIKKQ